MGHKNWHVPANFNTKSSLKKQIDGVYWCSRGDLQHPLRHTSLAIRFPSAALLLRNEMWLQYTQISQGKKWLMGHENLHVPANVKTKSSLKKPIDGVYWCIRGDSQHPLRHTSLAIRFPSAAMLLRNVGPIYQNFTGQEMANGHENWHVPANVNTKSSLKKQIEGVIWCRRGDLQHPFCHKSLEIQCPSAAMLLRKVGPFYQNYTCQVMANGPWKLTCSC